MHWRTFWTWLATWQGAATAAVAVLAALYYGPRKMLETWDWYWDRWHDYKIVDLLKHPPSRSFVGKRGESFSMPWPSTVGEIAIHLKWKESSVSNALRRLERRGKVFETQEGWHLKR